MVELVTGAPPYAELNSLSAMYHIATEDHPPFPEGISADLQHFLKRCWQKTPANRATASQLLQEPFLQLRRAVVPDEIVPTPTPKTLTATRLRIGLSEAKLEQMASSLNINASRPPSPGGRSSSHKAKTDSSTKSVRQQTETTDQSADGSRVSLGGLELTATQRDLLGSVPAVVEALNRTSLLNVYQLLTTPDGEDTMTRDGFADLVRYFGYLLSEQQLDELYRSHGTRLVGWAG